MHCQFWRIESSDMKKWMLALFALIWFGHLQGQGTLNIASGKAANQSIEVYFAVGGEIFSAISNSTYSLIASTLPFNQNLITEVEGKEPIELKAYPNPFFDQLFVDLPNPYSVQLMDSKGVILIQTYLKTGELDVGGLSQGLYLIRVLDDKNSKIIKVIKYEK